MSARSYRMPVPESLQPISLAMIAVPDEVYQRIEIAARAEGVSVSVWLSRLVERALPSESKG